MAYDDKKIGAFTPLVARLARHGAVKCTARGTPESTTDTYQIFVPDTDARIVPADVSGLPKPGDAHPLHPRLQLQSLTVREHAPGETVREIEAEYVRGGATSQTPTPSEKIGIITAFDYTAETLTQDLVHDAITGAPVLNSAGDVFDSVPSVERVLTGIHIARLEAEAPLSALAMSGAVNAAAITIGGVTFAPRTARLRVTARNRLDGSAYPWEVDYTITPRTNKVPGGTYVPAGVEEGYTDYDFGWDVVLYECGYRYIDADGKLVGFTVEGADGETRAPDMPQPLTNDGRDNSGGGYGDVYLVVRAYPGADFASLQLPEAQEPPVDDDDGDDGGED